MTLIKKAIERLHVYEDAIMGKLPLDDNNDAKVVQFANMYRNMAKKTASIIASLRHELTTNDNLKSASISGGQILMWLNTALKYSFEFGSSNKRLYLLPYKRQILLYFGFEAYREVVQKQFNIDIVVEPYSKTEISNYHETINPQSDERMWDIPDTMPAGCQSPIKDINDIWGFKIMQIKSDSNREVIIVKKYKADKAILSANYINQVSHKPMWALWTYQMARKRGIMFHIKEEFVLRGNSTMSEMMDFELNQEKDCGLIS